MGRARLTDLGLAVLAFALALVQRPGRATSDTKIDLHVDPGGFLVDVASVWTTSGALGHVQGGQYSGYLFPMGPWFWLGHTAGLPEWLVHRLWLGAVLAAAAIGVAHLVRALLSDDRGSGLAALVAGAAFVLNPYVVVFANRTSVTLLAYAALPWLLLAVHRGLHDPRGWWWPAAAALMIGAAGGGVNAAVIAWILLGPVTLAAHEVAIRHVDRRALWPFAWRTALCLALASPWWATPVLVQALFGVDFLQFTEQPGTIWGTTSASEALRLMGYWPVYVPVGFTGTLRPYFADASALLFHPAVVLATLLVPAFAVAGALVCRRWAYGPFFLGLVVLGVVIVVAGFPEGTPSRQGLYFIYNRVDAVQFLRTSYKAAPLAATGIAVLAGAAAGALWPRLGRRLRPAAAIAAVLLLALNAWPLVRGKAVDPQLMWDEIPAPLRDAGRDLDRELAAGTRALVFPGELFGHYTWGGTVDAIMPVLTERPVAVRTIVPYADLHAIDLLWTTDALLSQQRLLPGQLRPLLRLLGASAVVLQADTDRSRSGALGPADVEAELDRAGGLGAPGRRYGASRRVLRGPGSLERARRLPFVQRFDVPDVPPLVRVEPLEDEAVIDGSAAAVAGLAAFGELPRAFRYAGDVRADDIARARELVVSDSNRRRVFVAARLRHNAGATLGPADEITEDAAVLDPVPTAPRGAQTVAAYGGGVRSVRAPFSPGVTQFPERRPFAAIDGDPGTAWLADGALDRERHWIEVTFDRPRDVPVMDVLPYDDARGATSAIRVGDRRHALRPGWNRLEVGLRDARAIRVTIARVDEPRGKRGAAGGIAELRVPGVRPTEALRPPTLVERAVTGRDLAGTGLTYLFERTTGDDPFRREGPIGPLQARDPRDRGDAERHLARVVELPAARAWTADAWVTVDPRAPDHELDSVAGTERDGRRFDSSGRYQGRPGHRASRAFDGDPATAWIAPWRPDGGTVESAGVPSDARPAAVSSAPATLNWFSTRPRTVRELRLVPAAARVRRPALVSLSVDGRRSPPARVAADGTVTLLAPVRGRAFRLEVLRARSAGIDRAIGIAEVRGAGMAAPRGAGPVTLRCGALTVELGDGQATVRPRATRRAFDAGEPLRARPCGAPARTGAGPATITTQGSLVLPHLVRLRSPAPAPAAEQPFTGRVTDLGTPGRSTWKGVRVELGAPSRLVLAQSYNPGWRARCDGRDLGAPEPVDGYANGWRAPADCREVDFAFAPDRAVGVALVGSGIASLLLLAFVVVRRPRRCEPAAGEELPEVRQPVTPWRRALLVGLAAGAVLGFAFAIRAGLLIAPVVALVLRHGVDPARLIGAAAALLGVVVPALYLLDPADDRGGYNYSYAVELIGAHWVAVAALVLLLVALAQTYVSTARGRRAGRPR